MAVLAALLSIFIFTACTEDNSRKDEETKPGASENQHVLDEQSNSLPKFLAVSDVHLNANAGSIKVSGHHIGDTDTTLWDFTKAKINTVISNENPKFMIYLGDLPAHYDPSVNLDNNHRKDLGKVLHDLREIAQAANIPFLYAPGNNDGIDGDYSPFTNAVDSTPFDMDVGHAEDWPMIMPQSDPGTDPPVLGNTEYLDLGFYSAYPLGKQAGLRAIVMNTVIFNNAKYNQYDSTAMLKDARTQFTWLEAELESAASHQEPVMILMHIPPGLDGYGTEKEQHNAYMWRNLKLASGELILNHFIDLVTNPKYNITSMFYSHTHMDEIRILHGTKDESVDRLAVSLPGITPGHNNNPGFKTVTYDPAKGFAAVDFQTYYSAFFPNHTVQAYGDTTTYTFRASYGYTGTGTMWDAIKGIGTPNPDLGFDSTAVAKGMNNTYQVHHTGSSISKGVREAILVEKQSTKETIPSN